MRLCAKPWLSLLPSVTTCRYLKRSSRPREVLVNHRSQIDTYIKEISRRLLAPRYLYTVSYRLSRRPPSYRGPVPRYLRRSRLGP